MHGCSGWFLGVFWWLKYIQYTEDCNVLFSTRWKTIMQESRIPTFGLVVDHTSKVLDAKLCFISVFRWNVVGVEFVLRVEFVQHGGVCTLRLKNKCSAWAQDTVCQRTVQVSNLSHLGKLALLVNERDDIHGLYGNHVQGVLVVSELNVLPVNVLKVIFFLLQLENMTDEELLQVFIGKVDTQLLKAGGEIQLHEGH